MRDVARTEPDSTASATRPVVVMGGYLRCPQCSHRNPAERQYCADCGTRIWEKCIACGAATAIQEKYCGACGVDLAQAIEERTAAAQNQLDRAQALRQSERYQEAIDALAAVAGLTDHRLESFRTRAVQLLSEVDAERQNWYSRRDQAFQWAQDCFARSEIEEAATALEQVPDWLRSEGIRELLQKIRERQAETAFLTTEIREALAAKKWVGLLSRVQRLIVLQPANEQAQRLAEKLRAFELKQLETERQKLCQAAKVELDRRNYAGVAKLLAKVQESVRTPQINKLLEESQDKAEEIVWLRDDLYHAVEFDEHLLPIARRLLDIVPDDKSGRIIATQLIDRQTELEAEPRHQPRHGVILPWMKVSKKKSARAFPVECFPGLRQVFVSREDAARPAAADPENYCVAIGLALQGLGKVPMEINLVPQQGQGMFGLFKQAMQKRTAKTVWGIDLGRRALKAVRLSLGDGNKFVVESADCIEHDTMLNQPDAKPAEILARTLDTLLSRHEIGRTPICLSMPSSMVFARYLTLPDVAGKKLDKAMRYEVQQQLPVAVEETTWDFQVISKLPDPSGLMAQIEVALFALKTDLAKQYIEPWQARELKVDILQSDTAAMHNFFSIDYFARDLDAKPDADATPAPMVAILDIGTEVSNLLVTNGLSLWTRGLSVGGNQFTRAISRGLEISFADAEELKREPTKAQRLGTLYQTMEPVFQELLNELQRSLDHYAGLDRPMFERLFVQGGGLQLHSLLRRLRMGH